MKNKTGKEKLISTLQYLEHDTIPWVPLAGVHAGKLKGFDARTVLTDGEKLLESLLGVNSIYQPDGQPIYFDVQVEAEILGCDLVWAEDTPPSVSHHPLAHQKSVPTHLPENSEGRLPMILNTMRSMTSAVGERTALWGLVTGPLSLAFHLRGHQLFFDLMDDPAYLQSLITYTTHVTQHIAGLYLEAGMDVIGIIEPVASQISPADFQTLLLPPLEKIFRHIHDADSYGMLHICGKATQIIEAMCLTGADSLSLDENVNLPEVQRITDRYQVILQGNIPVISHLLEGRPEDVQRYVDDLITQLPSPQNLILSPGCDLPWDTPVENVLAALEGVKSHPLPEKVVP